VRIQGSWKIRRLARKAVLEEPKKQKSNPSAETAEMVSLAGFPEMFKRKIGVMSRRQSKGAGHKGISTICFELLTSQILLKR
jgi:hypothetical protein